MPSSDWYHLKLPDTSSTPMIVHVCLMAFQLRPNVPVERPAEQVSSSPRAQTAEARSRRASDGSSRPLEPMVRPHKRLAANGSYREKADPKPEFKRYAGT